MPRIARVVIPDLPHHVTQRGHRREQVFFAPADYQRYLDWLGHYSQLHQLKLLGYCLMPNHVHLIAVPHHDTSLAGALKPLHLRYAQYVALTQQRPGRVWQGRFFSCPLSDQHLWAALRYVERNPVRAGLVEQATAWPWSSAAAHCGLSDDPLLSQVMETVEPIGDWPAWLALDVPDEATQLRRRTATGRPLGPPEWVAELERRLGRNLTARPVGRPKRE